MSRRRETREEPPRPRIRLEDRPSMLRLVPDLLICLAFGALAAMHANLFYCRSLDPQEAATVHDLTYRSALFGAVTLACALFGANRLSHIIGTIAECWRLAGLPAATDLKSRLFSVPGPTPLGSSFAPHHPRHGSMPTTAPGTSAAAHSPPTSHP